MPKDAIAKLEQNLEQCLGKDRFRFKKRLQQIRAQLKKGAEPNQDLARLAVQLERSAALRALRVASIPKLTFPELPVADKKAEIEAAIAAHQVVVICGETGSGKTTQLPKICLELGRGCDGMIAHTQPRRIAARSVAGRIAEELGQPVGGAVGYKIRFSDQTRPETLIKLMTDGILLAEIQSDPYLNHYDTVIIDEAHERSLNIDFLLGYLKWLLPKRPDLKLIITSATIDPERFSRHFGDAPIVEVSGRTYPVEIRYQAVDPEEEGGGDPMQALLEAVDQLQAERSGDILIFLSGEREIRETAEALRKHHPAHSEILPLYSRLSASEQQRIFKPHGNRRIILATNVAETSLTVPGIHCVIDAGYARISRYSYRGKLQRLPIEKISQASANQRAGRCGRIAAGICIRLYSQEDFESRPEFTEPEILRTNLAAVILQMCALGLGDIGRFPFVEPPDDRMIRDGYKLLHELNAIDERKQLTPLGKRLARLPVDPRLGRMLLAAEKENCLTEVAVIVAALSIQDPRERPLEYAQAADQQHARFHAEGSDFLAFCNVWNEVQEKKKHLSTAKFRRYCRDSFLSYLRLREWQDVHQQLLQLIKNDLGMRPNQVPAGYDEIHRALLTGLLSYVGFRHDPAEYLGARNLRFHIHPGSSQFKTKPKWIMAAEQVETTRVYARTVARIAPEWVEKAALHLVQRQHYEPHWEKKPARAAIFERVSLYGLVLSNRRSVPLERIDPAAARELFIRSALVHQEFNTREAFFHHNQSLLEEVGYLQHKGRRIDLVADEEWLFGFYDERLPAAVVSGVTFDQWLAEKKEHRQRLRLNREQITQHEAASLSAADYPDVIAAAGTMIPLDYRFEPGHPEDGVTAIVPLHLLNQLQPAPFQWLVPGLLKEKIIALIKSLPKSLRRNFVPAPDYAERCLPDLEPGAGSLQAALGEVLHRLSGIRIDAASWSEAALPDHLRMNFRIIDDKGKVCGQSRDLAALQAQLGQRAGHQFQTLAAAALTHSGRRAWDFGELPEIFQGGGKKGGISGFPAVVDEGDSVGVQVFAHPDEARQRHRQGLIRLLGLLLEKDVRYLQKQLSPQAGILYQHLPVHPFAKAAKGEGGYAEELIGLILADVFLDEAETIRSDAALSQRIEARKSRLIARFNEIRTLVDTVLKQHQELRRNLQLFPAAPCRRDVEDQLGLLVYAHFLRWTTAARLKEFPRYLRAIAHRLEKARQDPVRDRQKQQELASIWSRYWSAVRSGEAIPLEDDALRWALEEFRVSLFAQPLKTAYPVSLKRLEKLWADRPDSDNRYCQSANQ